MGKSNFFYFLFLSGLMLFSCNNPTIKDKIDGGNYKFWFSIEETGTIVYYYFGSDGRYDVFIKNEPNGFHRYNTVANEDDLIPNKWILKNDSIGWGTDFPHILNLEDYKMVVKYKCGLDTMFTCYDDFYQIVNLEDHKMVIKYKYRLDTLFSCYDGMIPDNYNHKW